MLHLEQSSWNIPGYGRMDHNTHHTHNSEAKFEMVHGQLAKLKG